MKREIAKIMSKLVLADKTVNIKLLGDSITHGVGGTGFEQNGELIAAEFRRNPDGYCWAKQFKEHCEATYNCKVTNNACTGTTINFILENFDTLVSPEDDIVICTIGTNNRHQFFVDGPKKTRDEMMKNFYGWVIELHNKFKAANKDVIFVANIPACTNNEQDTCEYWRILHMNDINDLYLKASAECGFPLISMYNAMVEYCELSEITLEELLDDGLHPNDRGYDIMFSLILRELGLGKKMY
ncbi:MAG: SGNH/GDSL hydrolase family protein [Ruminococcaceae bacterium]|nr:SGNH/GDSL hydrolase family protein [Oscillospiraceae bacterium]